VLSADERASRVVLCCSRTRKAGAQIVLAL
jgi:hypothetical protein